MYTFTLKNIDIPALLLKNGYVPQKQELEVFDDEHHILEEGDDKHVTNISDLMHEKSTKYITIIDPAKNSIKMWITMIDFVREGFLPISTNLPCWWCRGNFDTSPIGCPIRYCSDNTPAKIKKRVIEKLELANLPTDTSDFFETEGIFCSFPCCKAYIISQKGSPIYKESHTLLTLMYYKLYGKYVRIRSAAPFYIIDTWGGHLTLKEFRDSHCQLTYKITPNIKRPFMCSTGMYIEEKKSTA